ncbi:MAG: SusC/RagA family TonB-linked outer membrane protein [Draconibacterium sp.]
MKKLISVLGIFLLGMQVFAQKNISGSIKTENGEPVVGANVWIKGNTAIGTTANADGFYSLEIKAGAKAHVICFSFIGMKTKEVVIGTKNEINVVLENAEILFDDVVVTALGISREERSLGYSVQKVSSDDMAVKDPTSISNSLQGRVAGVQVKSGAGTVGGSSSVIIRGMSSLGGSNQPLYIVDGTPISNYNISNSIAGYDYGNGAQDINPDDVASVSVLKGAAATTLYGSRGANGVIIITTKSGKTKKGLGVEVNSTTTFDDVYILPKFQNEYGGGSSLDFPTFDFAASGLGEEWTAFDGTPVVETGVDESWGPKFNRQQVLHWDSFVPESKNYLKTRPWVAHPDNYKNLFDTGLTLSNSVSVDGGSDVSSFRLSYTNINQKGVVPNSELKKNMIALKGSTKVTERIEVLASVNYVRQETEGRSQFGYSGDGSTVAGAMRIWTQRQVDADLLRKYWYSDALGHQVGWNFRDISNGRTYMRWSNNPFWTLNNIYASDAKNRVYGNVGFKIDLMEGLTFTATARTDYYSMNVNDRIGSGGVVTDYYGESTYSSLENNYEGIFNYDRHFGDDWSLNAMFGGNIRYSKYKSSGIETVDGLVIENFYSVTNTVSPANVRSYFSERQINSVFASASVGFKNMLYFDISGRNDWSSTLPVNAHSYFYPSFSASFVFSELLSEKSVLSLGKIRAGYAMVGNDTSPYRLYNSYGITSFGNTTTFTVSDTRQNPNLKSESTAEFEAGIEAAFLKGRVGAEFTYFNRKSSDQIFGLDVSNTTGYTNAVINAGELQNTGFEAVVYGTPVKTPDFSWNLMVNFSQYESKLNSLYGDLEEYVISDAGSAWVTAVVRGEYGIMFAAGGYEYDSDGNKLVDENGLFVRSGKPEEVGSILPDFNGGVTNTFSYKNFSLTALVDFQKGGLVYSWANRWATGAGQTHITVGENDNGVSIRESVEDGGGVKSDGVFAPGTPKAGQPNDIYVGARTYFRHLRNFQEEFVYDASFIKLREVKLSYALPSTWIEGLKLQSATVSLVGRNLALLHSNADGFDPEQVNSTANDAQGYEGGSLPSTRSIGFNVNLKF